MFQNLGLRLEAGIRNCSEWFLKVQNHLKIKTCYVTYLFSVPNQQQSFTHFLNEHLCLKKLLQRRPKSLYIRFRKFLLEFFAGADKVHRYTDRNLMEEHEVFSKSIEAASNSIEIALKSIEVASQSIEVSKKYIKVA